MPQTHSYRFSFQRPPNVQKAAFLRSLLIMAVACSAAFLATSPAQAQTCAATVDKTVVICPPANGASVSSPVQFTAAAKDNEANVTAMAVYVDGIKMATGQGANFSASATLSAGSHSFDVKAWDSSGASFASVRYT